MCKALHPADRSCLLVIGLDCTDHSAVIDIHGQLKCSATFVNCCSFPLNVAMHADTEEIVVAVINAITSLLLLVFYLIAIFVIAACVDTVSVMTISTCFGVFPNWCVTGPGNCHVSRALCTHIKRSISNAETGAMQQQETQSDDQHPFQCSHRNSRCMQTKRKAFNVAEARLADTGAEQFYDARRGAPKAEAGTVGISRPGRKAAR